MPDPTKPMSNMKNHPLALAGCFFLCGLFSCSDGTVLETYEGGQKKAQGLKLADGSKDGRWVSWHKNGKKKLEGVYTNGKREGTWTGWFENGQKSGEGLYKNGKQTGLWVAWYWSGRKAAEGLYAAGKKEGAWKTYKEDGSVYEKLSGNYKAGEKISGLSKK